MEYTVQGTKGDIGIDSKAIKKKKTHVKLNGNFELKKVAPKNLLTPRPRTARYTTGTLSTKCGLFTKQVNVNWKSPKTNRSGQ